MLMQENGTAITIGTFDGVHLGHQFLINKTIEIAKNEKLQSLVLTFTNHPRTFLNPNYRPLILTELPTKIELIKKIGVDTIELIEFNQQIANLSATKFVQEILIQKYGLKHLIIGPDFALGKNRVGNFKFLTELGLKLGFKVTQTADFKVDNIRPSSGVIRDFLINGDLQNANKFLGRNQD